MKNWFLCADTHFTHSGITKYFRPDGVTKQRPWNDPKEMDAALVDNWNRAVGPKDTVVIIGDMCINRSAIPVIGRCNGKKILVKGNHDNFNLSDYAPYIDDIHAALRIETFMLTHIPIHTSCVTRWTGNIHGHLHEQSVMRPIYGPSGTWEGEEIDPRYLCVSMEQIDYTPIAFDDAIIKFNKQNESKE